jgi:hypothetical protein
LKTPGTIHRIKVFTFSLKPKHLIYKKEHSLPIATVQQKLFADLDPSVYTVRTESFEGPLDLLLYLIRKNEVDIYNIPIAALSISSC